SKTTSASDRPAKSSRELGTLQHDETLAKNQGAADRIEMRVYPGGLQIGVELAEAEADQGKGGADPGHQSALGRRAIALLGEFIGHVLRGRPFAHCRCRSLPTRTILYPRRDPRRVGYSGRAGFAQPAATSTAPRCPRLRGRLLPTETASAPLSPAPRSATRGAAGEPTQVVASFVHSVTHC